MRPSRFLSNTIVLETTELLSNEECLAAAQDLLEECWEHYGVSSSSQHGSLYYGDLGPCCYLRLVLANFSSNSKELLTQAEELARSVLKEPKERHRVTLLESKFHGAFAMLSAIQHRQGDTEGAIKTAEEVLFELKIASLRDDECSVLYGRSGVIGCALFLRQHLGNPHFGQDLAVNLACDILQHGKAEAEANPHYKLPLLWFWHNKIYLGAAHGIVGIVQTILSLTSAELDLIGARLKWDIQSKLQSTIDALVDHYSFPVSGNLKSSVNSSRDKLVQWCHGATGFILLLVRAYRLFGLRKYLDNAKELAHRVIWSRGLLKKGVGLCHGISGNAYAFLALAQVDDPEGRDIWLTRAHAFARYGLEHLQVGLKDVPDRPFSMFDGVGGLACLLLHLRDSTSHAYFPLYDFSHSVDTNSGEAEISTKALM